MINFHTEIYNVNYLTFTIRKELALAKSTDLISIDDRTEMEATHVAGDVIFFNCSHHKNTKPFWEYLVYYIYNYITLATI